MKFTALPPEGAYTIDLEPLEDNRGFFARVLCRDEMIKRGLPSHWPQVNLSLTHQIGSVRGMHFQRQPSGDAKIVRCVAGAVFDVMVDLRAGSPTFGAWTAVELSSANRRMAFVPIGFAHGFQSLKPDSELLYHHSAPYDPDREGGVNPCDLDIGIDWPLPIRALSPRDLALPALGDVEPLKL